MSPTGQSALSVDHHLGEQWADGLAHGTDCDTQAYFEDAKHVLATTWIQSMASIGAAIRLTPGVMRELVMALTSIGCQISVPVWAFYPLSVLSLKHMW